MGDSTQDTDREMTRGWGGSQGDILFSLPVSRVGRGEGVGEWRSRIKAGLSCVSSWFNKLECKDAVCHVRGLACVSGVALHTPGEYTFPSLQRNGPAVQGFSSRPFWIIFSLNK